VDLVRNVEDFEPGKRSWRGDLFLKEFQCSDTGRTSLGWSCVNGWTTHSDGKTKYPYFLKEMDGNEYLFLPWLSGDVTQRGQKPSYYVLEKVSGETQTPGRQAKPGATTRKSFQTVRPITSVKEFDDVRWKDMSKLDLSAQSGLPATLRFNENTVWPDAVKMPGGCDPRRLLSQGMNPGLGIRDLHGQGITGKGVNVAIIDQPLYQDHPEFAGKIVAYHDVGCGTESSMHGPAVASLLVGSNCGTAPGARVYYVAAPSWTRDTAYQAKALDWIIEQNEELLASEKIRVVSVSAAPSGPGSPFDRNQEMWDKACARAESKGLMVLDCTQHRGIIGPCYYDLADPDNISKCRAGFPGRHGAAVADSLLVPCSPRTTAEEYNSGEHSYQYCGRGGLSWSIPYSAGVLALGWELRPDLTAAQMQECLFNSAYTTNEGAKVINPKEFIRMIKAMPKGVS
jgi:hypothetical protein